MSITTLMKASEQSTVHGVNVYLPWSWAVTAAITFFPVGVTLLALMGRIKGQDDLHGAARFANNKELEQFAYRGEYH
jgi:Na+-driven multidrug efflux pump